MNKFLEWLKGLWFQVSLFELDYDLEGATYIDLLSINAGDDNDIHFHGSLFMLYMESASLQLDGKAHWQWDLLYSQRLLQCYFSRSNCWHLRLMKIS